MDSYLSELQKLSKDCNARVSSINSGPDEFSSPLSIYGKLKATTLLLLALEASTIL